jgi:hypothetical protein
VAVAVACGLPWLRFGMSHPKKNHTRFLGVVFGWRIVFTETKSIA